MELFCENSQWLKAIIYIPKKTPFQLFDRDMNMSLAVCKPLSFNEIWGNTAKKIVISGLYPVFVNV